MRSTLTRVEVLARQSLAADGEDWLPGLLALAEKVYPEPGYLEDLREFICAKSRQTLPLSTISSFVQKRFLRPKFTAGRIVQILEEMEKKLGADFTGNQARAVLHQGVTEAVKTGRQVSLEFGLKETRLWDQQKVRSRQLELEIAKLKAEQEGAREKVKALIGGAASAEVKDKGELLRQVDEIYGVYQKADPPPVPGEVGGG